MKNKGIEIRLLVPSGLEDGDPPSAPKPPSTQGQAAVSPEQLSPVSAPSTGGSQEPPSFSPFDIYAQHLAWTKQVSEENRKIWQQLISEL